MANTLGNPTTVEGDLAEDMLAVLNTKLNVGGGANAILRIRNSTTNLVDFLLNATTPVTLTTDNDGLGTLNFVSGSAVASGGAATLANNYQILDKAGTVRLAGPATSTDGISTGQTVNIGTITLGVPLS
jgi:hypothetical protein